MQKEFKASFLPTFIQAFGVMLLLLLLTEGSSIKIAPLLFGTAIVILGVLGLIYFTKVTVTNIGIWGFDMFGGQHFVSWDEMVRVKKIGISYLSYYLLYHSAAGLTLWIPRFLTNFKGFKEAVLVQAPSDNILKIFLIKH